jgi:hypothetical protein
MRSPNEHPTPTPLRSHKIEKELPTPSATVSALLIADPLYHRLILFAAVG